jgi:glucose/mannose-6-phosphate isomerase
LIDLDDAGALTEHDSLGVLGDAETLSEQIRPSWQQGANTPNLPDPDGVTAVAVLGMGGSGFAGDALEAVLGPRVPLFTKVIKDYSPLPEWVGRNTLVLAVSYSGNTEETLDAVREARERGARAVAVSCGGSLREAAKGFGMAHVPLPEGFLPRFAAGHMLMSLLGVMEALGFAPSLTDDVEEVVRVLGGLESHCNRNVATDDNPAKSLAQSLAGRLPAIYGGPGHGAVAARRFKTDLSENAKIPAIAGAIPEACHNDIEAWGHWTDSSWPFAAVLLRDDDEHPRVARRFDLLRDLLAGRLETVTIRASGQSRLARLLSLVGMCQLTSVYLALSSGQDPGPIDVLEDFKQRLAQATS